MAAKFSTLMLSFKGGLQVMTDTTTGPASLTIQINTCSKAMAVNQGICARPRAACSLCFSPTASQLILITLSPNTSTHRLLRQVGHRSG